ncbi:MAG: hypothetical protein JWO02_170 [Solirubrobacterales bacterium]|nr:hypothetical protein [Solirubrobacterales bacterium]
MTAGLPGRGARPGRRVGVALVAAFALAGGATATGASAASSKTYIVQLKAPPIASYAGGTAGVPATSPARTGTAKVNVRSDAATRYRSYLAGRQRAALARAGGSSPTVEYSYRVAFSGFTARLTKTQVTRLRNAPEVAKVWENAKQQPQAVDVNDATAVDAALGGPTGDGASYLGLPTGLWQTLGGPDHAGEGVIVGVIDTGIQPGHPSFADDPTGNYEGSPYSPPSVWNGTCQTGPGFDATDCNNKLIGARYFVEGFGKSNLGTGSFVSPRDDDGHGSHTAATAAGNFGVKPSIGGNPLGVDRISGMAPRAYVAAYKVCWVGGDVASGCTNADSVAAIEAAVADGVDVINYSVGSSDSAVVGPTELAFLGAVDAGVFVATSAGNDGPDAGTVGSPAAVPWVTTVGASTLARTFNATATVTGAAGPAATFTMTGASVTGALPATDVVNGADAGLAGVPVDDATLCKPDALDPAKVGGKVVICKRGDNARVDKGHNVLDAGGVGMVLYNASDAQELVTDTHFVPAVHVSFTDGQRLIGALKAGTQLALTAGTRDDTAPKVMAAFSSRGPQTAVADIPKPDVTAPGVNILAAAADQPAPNSELKAGELFQSISGTSMSSPHVAGAGALLTQAHPTWSAAEIKSALMTSADPVVVKENGTDAADPFDDGSGEIDPTAAATPGLVLDAGRADYVAYLRGIDPAIVGGDGPQLKATDLNLPAISSSAVAGRLTATRTFTSVDGTAKQWTATVTGLAGFTAEATPATFQIKPGQSVDVEVSATRTTAPVDTYAFGALDLTDGSGRHVRLPLSLRPIAVAAPATIAFSTDQASGARDVPVGAGFAGSLSALGWGLAAPTVKPAQTVGTTSGAPVLTGSDAGTKLFPIDVPAGAELLAARLANVDAGNLNTDLDLFLYRDPNGDGDLADAVLVEQSASGSSDERVRVTLPAAGRYVLAVVGFTTQSPSSTFDLESWVVTDDAPDAVTGTSAGITVTGDPLAVLSGQTATPKLGWDAVASKGLYLGLVTYHSDATPTLANVIGSSVVELTKTVDAATAGGGGVTTPTTPTTSTTPTTPATTPTTTTTTTTPKAKPVVLRVTARGAKLLSPKRVRFTLKLSRRASTLIAIRRGTRTVQSTTRSTLPSGSRLMTLKLSRPLQRGTYTVLVTARVAKQTDRGSVVLRVR